MLFSPRRGARPLLGALLALTIPAGGVAVLLAWQSRTQASTGAAAGLVALALLLWAARRRAVVTTICVEDGVLKILRGESKHQFPLSGPYPPIDILGEPGDRGWRVLIQRRGMAPYVVTARMVDPAEFTEVVRRFRPHG